MTRWLLFANALILLELLIFIFWLLVYLWFLEPRERGIFIQALNFVFKVPGKLAYLWVYPVRLIRLLFLVFPLGLFLGLLIIAGFLAYGYDPSGARFLSVHQLQGFLDRHLGIIVRPWVYKILLAFYAQGGKLLARFSLFLFVNRLVGWFLVPIFAPQCAGIFEVWVSFLLGLLCAVLFLLQVVGLIFSPFYFHLTSFAESWRFFRSAIWSRYAHYDPINVVPPFIPGQAGFTTKTLATRMGFFQYGFARLLARWTGQPLPERSYTVEVPDFSPQGFVFFRQMGSNFRHFNRPRGLRKELRAVDYRFWRLFTYSTGSESKSPVK